MMPIRPGDVRRETPRTMRDERPIEDDDDGPGPWGFVLGVFLVALGVWLSTVVVFALGG